MTKITTPADRTPAELRAIAADLRAGNRPDDAALRRIAAELEEIAAAREGRPETLTPSERQSLLLADSETSAYARKAFRRQATE